MNLNSGERNKTLVVFLCFCVWGFVIFFFLFKLQVVNYEKYTAKVKSQSNRIIDLHQKRGTIFDRNGEVMAISVKAKSSFLSNKNIEHSLKLFRAVSGKLSLKKRERREILRRIKKGYNFIWLKRQMEESEFESLKAVKDKNLSEESDIGFVEEYKRIYPQKRCGSHILGGVGIDNQGLFGLEYSMDSKIRGKGGKARVHRDARKKVFRLSLLDQPEAGSDITLTIDSSIQFFVERELKNTVRKYRAKTGSVIVMDSKNGEILSMASYPDFNPARISDTKLYRIKNRALSFLYDPGSTFKVIVACSALENNVCYPQQVFNCYNGVYKVHDRRIIDVHKYKELTFDKIIVYSSNVGAARIGMRLGRKRLYESIKMFGYGKRSGIELPAEERGILNPLKRWSDVSVAFLSFGYEIAVTPIQMARSFNVVASGGLMLQPTVIRSVTGEKREVKKVRKVLSDSTLHRMSSIMVDVVGEGTGKNAALQGLEIAGKTGTAKKIKGNRYTKNYVASFGGFFPASNPRITMFVVIDEPQDKYYGGDVAAPLFKKIAEKLLIYMKIFPELDEKNEIRI